MNRIAGIIGVTVFFAIAPNLVWLARSTTRITNTGEDILSAVIVYVDDKGTAISELQPGDSQFLFLPKSGDANYRVSFVKGSSVLHVCQEYVEGDMYHMETQLSDAENSRCDATLPLFSSLLILKAI